ncbi:MAG: DUF1887 family protein [Enhydrobacter sp.]|nr:MAG: DUF1887 family protein [Enhydrobacter sp.]
MADLAGTRSDLSVRAVGYDGSELRWYDTLQAPPRTEAVDNLISIDGWLALHGYVEPNSRRDQRLARQKAVRARAALIDELGRLCFASAETWRVRAMLQLSLPTPSRIEDTASRLGVAKARLVDFLDEWDSIIAKSGQSRRKMMAWVHQSFFEEWIWLRLRAKSLYPDEVALGLQPAHVQRLDGSKDMDCDIDVMHVNQLHVIEAKAANPDEKWRDWIERLYRIKSALIGNYGQATLISAQPLNERGDSRRQAGLLRVGLVSGMTETIAGLERIALGLPLASSDPASQA